MEPCVFLFVTILFLFSRQLQHQLSQAARITYPKMLQRACGRLETRTLTRCTVSPDLQLNDCNLNMSLELWWKCVVEFAEIDQNVMQCSATATKQIYPVFPSMSPICATRRLCKIGRQEIRNYLCSLCLFPWHLCSLSPPPPYFLYADQNLDVKRQGFLTPSAVPSRREETKIFPT
jgi:hypothetical protein